MGASSISSDRRLKLERDFFAGVTDLRVGADLSSGELLDLAVEWFTAPSTSIGRLANDDIARVLRDLTKPAGIGLWEAVADSALPLPARITMVEACGTLFAGVFDQLCARKLVHQSETTEPLNICCFLWWEDFPGSSLLPRADGIPLRSAAISTMKSIWSSCENIACRESVIHGLGDWASDWGAPAQDLLQAFSVQSIDPRLQDYARSMLASARRGSSPLPPTLH
jgi:hypothetical protein